MAIYLFTSGTTWTIPTGVTNIQVECFGVANYTPYDGCSGGSYAKTNSIAVTPGNTLRISIASPYGGNSDVWATTVATGTPVVGATYTTSNSCLAKGSNTVSTSQVAASIGDLKYAGGGAGPVGAGGLSAQGGQAGPNGAGAAGGPSSSGGNGGGLYCGGGGANGGTSPQSLPSVDTPGYGRGGSGNPQGWGGYNRRAGSGPIALTPIAPTQDVLGTTNFVNNSASVINYGPYGGRAVEYFDGGCGGCSFYGVDATVGFIVVTTGAASANTSNFFQFF